ncbi:MAG: PAS domain-containing protein, partial [Anaerolineales bacterium]|nr:PAS domain-containing protein [Anaerolineales bacterium]
LRAYQQVAESGETCIFESSYSDESITKPTSFRIVVVPMAGDIAILAQDITKRKQAEDALQKSQTQLQAIMDYSPALISIKDLDGNIILANRSFSVLDAPPLNELIGKNVFEIFPKEVAEQLWKNDLAALQAKGPIRSEEVVKYKDGAWHTYWTVKFPIYLQSDQPFGICAISNDITDRKQAEDELRQSQENFFKAFISSPTALAITRLDDGKFLSINDAYTRIMGYEPAEILGHTPAEMKIYVNQGERDALVQQLREQGTLREYELLVNTKSGEARNLLVSMEPILYNKEASIISTFIDITERKLAEQKLAEYSTHLEEMVGQRTSELRDAQEQLVRQERLAA